MSDKKDLHWQKRQGRIKDENISNKENEVEIMEKTMDKIIAVAKARGCLKKGEELDYEKASRLLLEEFRSGKLGKVTLEFPKGTEEA